MREPRSIGRGFFVGDWEIWRNAGGRRPHISVQIRPLDGDVEARARHFEGARGGAGGFAGKAAGIFFIETAIGCFHIPRHGLFLDCPRRILRQRCLGGLA